MNSTLWTGVLTAALALGAVLLKSWVDWRTACLNAETQRRAQESLEKKDAYAEIHKVLDDQEKIQDRHDRLLKEHMELYAKYVACLAGGTMSAELDRVVKAVATYHATLAGSEESIGAALLVPVPVTTTTVTTTETK